MYSPKDNSSEGAGSGPAAKKEPQEDASKKALRDNILRIALTSEARQRLTNVRMVKPQLAQAIEEYIIQMASSGKLKHVINDDELKGMLGSMQGTKREFTIRRI